MKKQKIDLKIPLFFIWPFGSFLACFNSISSRSSAIIYVLFTTLFGYSFSFTLDSADSYRVAWVLDKFNHGTVSSTLQEYSQGYVTDLYRPLMYNVVEHFTDNPKILFLIFGFVFGIFSYKSLKSFFDIKGVERSIYVGVITLVFFSLNSIVNINGARFFTAAIICYCSIIQLMVYNKKVWILLLFSTVLFHFSFLFIIPFVLFSYAFKNKLFGSNFFEKLIFYFYLTTFFLALILDGNLFNIDFASKILPSSISRKIELYNSVEVLQSYEERGKTLFHTVQSIFGYSARFYVLFLILVIRKKLLSDAKDNLALRKMLTFILFMFSIAFLVSIFPSGGRFVIIITQLFFFFLLRFYIKYNSAKLKKYILGLLPVYSFQILFSLIFLAISLTSSTVWYGNVFWIIYEGIGFKFVYL